MGHKPSATADKHYTVRPLDLLRVHHEKIEAWILEQAGIVFDAKAAPGALRVVFVDRPEDAPAERLIISFRKANNREVKQYDTNN